MTDFETEVCERLHQVELALMALIHAISPEFDDVDEETFLVTLDGEVFDGMQREQGQSLG